MIPPASPATSPTVGPVLSRLHALADRTRVRVLFLLHANEYTVGEICRAVQLPQSTVSRHLGTLAQGGWVSSRPQGTSRYYRLSQVLDASAAELWAAVRKELSGAASIEEDRRRARAVLDARADGSRAFFRSEAGRWDRLREEFFGEKMDAALLAGLLDGTERIGDLGCGTGHLARLLAPFARRVIAIDRSPAMLELARCRLQGEARAEVIQGELGALPLASGLLDLAILSLVLHYVVDVEAVLAEAHRVLVPEGRLLIVEMRQHERTGFAEEMGHVWPGFRPEGLTALLGEAGFGSVRVFPLPPGAKVKGPGLFILRAIRTERPGREPWAVSERGSVTATG